ncbi:MAG: zinc-ribbon and FHA domain-containing protein [Acidimicrobiales bacterium]|nr:zinc-ribbon and FHA domain-containing protein [Acidimicrobiales bacterium]MCB9395294.1 FHA domain-containing protein [Acidimicrobiaceae bacterium]
MSTATCPNGHVSTDPEWCDTCGAPMNGPSAEAQAQSTAPPPSAGGSSVAAAPVTCPNCGSLNAADNLFCESCGYDFVTGQAPEPPPPDPAGPAPADPEPVEPAAPAGAPSRWTVIVEVDPVWYSLKGELADRPLPPPSTSTVPVFGHVALVGRTSQSRASRPEIALDTDTAVSRRHAQFVVEGDDLSVVDLSSTNGTHVVPAGEVPTDALAPLVGGVPHLLSDGDQVFLGAWSRLTVRTT